MNSGSTDDRVTYPARRRGSWYRYAAGVLAIIVLCASFGIPRLVRAMLENIYTPPALTQQRIDTYRRFVEFAEQHADHNQMDLTKRGNLGLDGEYCALDGSTKADAFLRQMGLSVKEGRELAELAHHFKRLGCISAYKEDGVVMFTNERNRLFPTPPGVLYSLDGIDPNVKQNEHIVQNRPFIKITGSWYMSRELVTPAFRDTGIQDALPKSRIDQSLEIRGLDFSDTGN